MYIYIYIPEDVTVRSDLCHPVGDDVQDFGKLQNPKCPVSGVKSFNSTSSPVALLWTPPQDLYVDLSLWLPDRVTILQDSPDHAFCRAG